MANKEQETEKLFKDQFALVGELLNNFVEVVKFYVRGDEQFNRLAYKVHEQEHELDMIRRKIEEYLYKGAYLPFFREDYIKLAAYIDSIANHAESVCDHFAMEEPELIEGVKEGLIELAELVAKTYDPMRRVLDALFSNQQNVKELCGAVSEFEQEVDRKEWKLINYIFTQTDSPLANKIINREFIQHIAKVSDIIEDAADWVRVMVIKRQV